MRWLRHSKNMQSKLFITDAKTIQCATKAGLVLCEPDEYGVPQWLGTSRQFNRFNELLRWVDEFNTCPWAVTMPF